MLQLDENSSKSELKIVCSGGCNGCKLYNKIEYFPLKER